MREKKKTIFVARAVDDGSHVLLLRRTINVTIPQTENISEKCMGEKKIKNNNLKKKNAVRLFFKPTNRQFSDYSVTDKCK